MKIFELTWRILCGEYEFCQREIRAFKTAKEANRHGDIEEYTNNTGKDIKRKPSERMLENAQESACWDFGWSYRFSGANELQFVGSDEGLYEVKLGGRCLQ